MINTLNNDSRKALKFQGPPRQKKICNLQSKSKALFDVAACKCENYSLCICALKCKVPTLERSFLQDQRTLRRMFIGNVDKLETARSLSSAKRWEKREKYYEKLSTESFAPKELCEEIDSDDCSSKNSTYEPSELLSCANYTEIPTVARVCDRYGVSNTAGAAIATATLIDYKIISNDNKDQVIDRNKLWRQREKNRKEILSIQRESKSAIKAIYFDGCRDKTIQTDGCMKVEEHITILEEPNSKYIGHCTIDCGKSSVIAEALIDFLESNYLKPKEMIAVGSDGTNVNTGWKRGVIRRLEENIGHPL